MRVRTQVFKPGVRKAPVQIISLDQFLRRARKACGYTQSRREILVALLNSPVWDGTDATAGQLYFDSPTGDTVVFWLEE
jgi:hypothetical protein